MIELAEGEVHLWCAFPDEWDGPDLAREARRILDGDEIARMERIRFAEGRRLFGVSHLLVRMALSNHAASRPDRWRFVRNGQGKPGIAPPLDGQTVAGRLAFNLAHTRGLAIVAVTLAGDVGADVERLDRPAEARRLVGRFFSAGEIAALEGLPPDRLQERFFLHWTLKEAAGKALGHGLSFSPDSAGFRLSGERPLRIEMDGTGPSDVAQWRFALLDPAPSYVAALAVKPDQDRTLVIKGHRLGPAGEVAPLALGPVGFSPGIAFWSPISPATR